MKQLKRCLAVTLLTFAATFAAVPVATGTPLALGGPWIVLDQPMATGDFFTAPDATHEWTLNCPSICRFIITDLFVATDRFEVYDGAVLIATTPLLPDWTALAAGPFDSPPWTDDPDIAFASGFFSSLVISLGAGSHSLSIKDIHIPPTVSGAPFGDGTVAFRAAIPEPATLALFGLALVGLGFVRRHKV
jgi:hypothetical protein